jgi:hypothetical protein
MLLSPKSDYLIIGDVHGCIDELKEILIQNEFTINQKDFITSFSKDKSIILLGDFVDKGSHQKIKETIEFIYKNYYYLDQNRQQLYLILGNHEEKVYRYITNDPKLEITAKTEQEKEKYYNTVSLLEKDSGLKDKFLKLYHESFIWLKYSYSDNFSVTLTHAPCAKRYLSKDNKESYRKMIKSTSRSKNPNIKLDKLIPFVHEEAEDNRHYHIFGHLSQPNIRKYKNRICIDTSAIYGNRLSAILLIEDRMYMKSVPFQKIQNPASQKYNLLFDF